MSVLGVGKAVSGYGEQSAVDWVVGAPLSGDWEHANDTVAEE